ncbi:hypothetical protein GCM10020358_47340 [Amorphoplanes nipponensis]|uniref:Uncharacterized protein n=1 Tax=Actinoplanes nipponensis TaxID=135950 RepID=A0A919JMC5_9ACTN|nr:hypothetical protein Ani05nite_29680 [Actinoplanes nipponensis]
MKTPTPPRHSSARIPAPIARKSRSRRFRGRPAAGTGPGGGTAGGGGWFEGCTSPRLVGSAVDRWQAARRVGDSARTGRIAHRLRNVIPRPVQGTV